MPFLMTPELFKQLSTETLSAVFPLAVISLADERNIIPKKIIANTGVTLEQLQRPSARITALAMGAIIYNFVRRVKDPSIGFELGLRSSHTKIGLLGFGLMSCSTYREALAMSLKYSRTLTPLLFSQYNRDRRTNHSRRHRIRVFGSFSQSRFRHILFRSLDNSVLFAGTKTISKRSKNNRNLV